jgi:hypothetical protein
MMHIIAAPEFERLRDRARPTIGAVNRDHRIARPGRDGDLPFRDATDQEK